MNPAVAPRALLPALVTRALASGGLHFACSLLLSPFAALASADATWLPSETDFDTEAPQPTPVVLVHGLFSRPGHFRFLHRFLVARGFQNFAAFSYAPRVDHEQLAGRLGRMIEAVCEVTGAAEVDVVGHSLGGLIARHLVDSGGSRRVRRLVTLGAPYYLDCFCRNELAIFAAHDPLVAAPAPACAPAGRMRVVSDCGHLGLLYHPTVLRSVAAYLGSRAGTVGPAIREVAREAA